MPMRVILQIFLIIVVLNTYGQDNGIVFQEDFEAATIAEMITKWDEAKHHATMSFSTAVPPGSPGSQSLVMTYSEGHNTGGHLYKLFPDGYDSLFARFYVKFEADPSPVHHFVHMGGYFPPTAWPQGGAGSRPV